MRACKHVCACVHKSMHAHTYGFKSLCCLVSCKYLQLRQIQAWQLLLQVIKVCHHSEENNKKQVQPQQPGTTTNCNHCNRNCQTCTFTCNQTKASTNLLQTAFFCGLWNKRMPITTNDFLFFFSNYLSHMPHRTYHLTFTNTGIAQQGNVIRF